MQWCIRFSRCGISVCYYVKLISYAAPSVDAVIVLCLGVGVGPAVVDVVVVALDASAVTGFVSFILCMEHKTFK